MLFLILMIVICHENQAEKASQYHIFSPIFQVILSKKTRILQSIDQRRMRGEYQQNPFWVLRKPLRRFLTMSDIHFNFFFPNTKIIYSAPYRPKSLQFGQLVQLGGGLDIYEWGWTRTKIQLCLNLGEGVQRDQKQKNYPFSSEWIENQKLYNIFKNQLPKSMRWGDMGIYPLLDLKKVLFLPYLPSKLS